MLIIECEREVGFVELFNSTALYPMADILQSVQHAEARFEEWLPSCSCSYLYSGPLKRFLSTGFFLTFHRPPVNCSVFP